MPLTFSGAAARVRRTLPPAVVAALALALPAGASAADTLGNGGVVIPGSAMKVGVSGATNQAGSLQARFSAVGSPLFWGLDTANMNDGTAAVFALNTPSGLYSPQSVQPVDNSPFTQTQAPALTGTGTVGDPYVVVSKFDANAGVHITQTITHVSGETKFKATWAVTNGTGSPSNFQGFEGADMYVNGNDNGNGTMSGIVPNRTIGSVASDGTQGQIVEQSVSPWTHYFSGLNTPFYNSTGDSTFGSLPDLIDPTNKDSGEGVEWDFTLANGATKTMSIVWNFTHPQAPLAPQITGGVPAASATTQATTANPAFTFANGDGSHVVGYECALDGGSFTTCATPKVLSGLADGSHTFSVRAYNSAGDPGPQADRTWTVDTTPPIAPVLTGAPTGTVAVDNASITLTGEAGATFRCSVDGGSYVGCSSPLVLTGLADGNHVVNVKQIDTANNTSTLVGTASWTVDTSVPAVPATDSEPVDTVQTDARLEFTTPVGLSAECSLDGGAYEACASPLDVSGLARGTHTLQLRMVNGAGTAGAARSITWEVKAPVVTSTPTVTETPTSTTKTETTTTTPAAQTPAKTTIVPVSCVSRRSVNVHWALPKGAKAKGFQILVDGKVVKSVSVKARAYKVSLAGRPAASVKVQVKALGAKLATTRTYRTCSPKAGNDELATVLLKKTA